MQLSDILALAASGLFLVVSLTYFLQIVRGQSTPNPATWTIWLAVSILNTITFARITDTWYQALIPATTAVCLTLLFIYALTKAKFTPFLRAEKIALGITGLVGVLWLFSGDDKLANLLLQGILLFAFWPTVRGLLKGTAREKALPWILSVIAYGLLMSSQLINFHGNYVALVYPFVNGVLGNGVIAILATKKSQLRPPLRSNLAGGSLFS